MSKLLESVKLTRSGKFCPALPILLAGFILDDWKIWLAGLSLFVFQEVLTSKIPNLNEDLKKELDEIHSYMKALGLQNGIKRRSL